ncbi:hypothetical protein [Corynebacterium uterequi]|uniref:MFS transporter n=1 Tax=Corynebacterium uterequi TaxID=1072256 RepID=A0A0G3HCU4_9CORY|nr:hypothetical protein [Corynebacterium uterequi]AKK10540.1 hypothetical protein CUTER_02625 [Corynebacterium uterequi]
MTTSPRLVPAPLKAAAIAAIIQALCAFGYSIYLIGKDLTTSSSEAVVSDTAAAQWIGTGTAIFLLIAFGAMFAAAVAALRGRVWGRGLIILMQAILLGCAWYMVSASMWPLAIVTAASALVGIVGTLHPESMGYAAAQY